MRQTGDRKDGLDETLMIPVGKLNFLHGRELESSQRGQRSVRSSENNISYVSSAMAAFSFSDLRSCNSY